MSDDCRRALAVAVSAGVPTLIWGGPGVGKTSAVREMAELSGLPVETVIASIREPSDFAGLPIVTADTTNESRRDSVHLAAPSWATRLAEQGQGILFLDEVSTAPPAVQAALLRVVLERTVGDLALPEGVRVVAAANPPEQAADGWDLAAPLANRFCHLDWTLDAREWTEGILSGFHTYPLPTIDADLFGSALAGARSAVAGFIHLRPQLLHAPPAEDSAAGRAWPSPRSWDMAARLLAACEVAGESEGVSAILVAGSVGPGSGAEFLAWRSELDIPDPEDVLRDPSSFRLPQRGDRAYAALASITAAVAAHNTPERWEAAWFAVAVGARSGQPDIAVAAVRSLIACRPDGAVPPGSVLQEMAPVLRTAGLFERLESGG